MAKSSKVFNAGGRTVASMGNRSRARPWGRRVFLLSSRAYSGRPAFNDRGNLIEGRFLGSSEKGSARRRVAAGQRTCPARLVACSLRFGDDPQTSQGKIQATSDPRSVTVRMP